MAGAGDATVAYVEVLRRLAEDGVEVLICVAEPDDGAVAPVRSLWPDAPILVGRDDTFNPKMNNVRKGLEAASRPVVGLCDAGIQLSIDELRRAAAPLAAGTGLVLALKAGLPMLTWFSAPMKRTALSVSMLLVVRGSR